MKKIVLLLLCLTPLLSFSQVTIKMEEDGGVYKVPCEVNGLRMKFIFDTGASNVCLSLAEARFMLENDYITSEDILGNSKSQIADGSIVENTMVRLKEIKIAGLVLKDVDAVVTHSFGAPLLLGQSAIQKLGTIQINGNELTILEHTNNVSKEYVDKLFEEANRYYEHESYIAASKKYQELYNLGALSDYGIYWLARSYDMSEKYKEAISYYNKIKDFTYIEKSRYYSCIGWCYIMLKQYDDALYCFELQGEHAKDGDGEFELSKKYMAITYKFKKDYSKALEIFEILLRISINKTGLDFNEAIKKVKKGKLKNDKVDEYIYEVMYCGYMKEGCTDSGFMAIVNLAKNGNKYALEFVRERNAEELMYY